jgi:hypothetical protein
MRTYTLTLRPLAASEISRIELFLINQSPIRTRSSTKSFLKDIAKILRRDEPRFRRSLVKIGKRTYGRWILSGSRTDLAASRDRWLLKVRAAHSKTEAIAMKNALRRKNGTSTAERRPLRGKALREIRPQWSLIGFNVKAEIDEREKTAELNLDFSVADQYFNWLLVRAIANEQICNFIECLFCGDVKYVGIARADVKFCCDDHRVQFHYRQSRMGAKHLLKERRDLRSKGIPSSRQDFSLLRLSGTRHGSRSAARILTRSSISLEHLDDAELEELRADHNAVPKVHR